MNGQPFAQKGFDVETSDRLPFFERMICMASIVSRCRSLVVETLESRLTPTVNVLFNPRALIALNPQPLPPGGPVQFDPQVLVREERIGAQSSESAFHLHGQFTEGVRSDVVQATYDLFGTIQQNWIPPGPDTHGRVGVRFEWLGNVTEVFTPPEPIIPSWTVTETIVAGGTLSGAVVTDPSGRVQSIDGTFDVGAAISQTEAASSGGPTWIVQATVNTTGDFHETLDAPGRSNDRFSVHDVIHENLCPATPVGAPPDPCTIIDAVFDGGGSIETDASGNPVSGSAAENPVSGSYHFDGRLQETITPPPSSPTSAPVPQTLTFELDGHGRFDALYALFPPGPIP
jgi:hypothetical protein